MILANFYRCKIYFNCVNLICLWFFFLKKCYFIPFSLIQWGFCSCRFSEVILVSFTNRHIHVKSCSQYSHFLNLFMTQLYTPTFFRHFLTWFLAYHSYLIVFSPHSFSWVPFYASSSLWAPLNIEIILLPIFLNSQVFCKFLLFILLPLVTISYTIASLSISRPTLPVYITKSDLSTGH